MLNTKDFQVTIIQEIKAKDGGWRKPMAWPPKPGLTHDDPEFIKHSLKGMWPKDRNACRTVSLQDVLSTQYARPTYFVSHAPTKADLRLNSNIFLNPEALEYIGGSVVMQLAIFDVDAHGAPDGETEEERFSRVDAWFQDELEKIEKLQEDMPGVLIYRSKNGYRILTALEEPMHLACAGDARAYKRQYTAWVKYLGRVYGMASVGRDTPDDLGDFNRFQRVPHDSHRSPLQQGHHEMLGDYKQLGYWRPKLEDKDWPKERAVATVKASYGTGEEGCLLLELVRQRGLRIEESGSHAGDYDICCPDWHRHSPNAKGEKDYPTKTRLIKGRLGTILCLSAGCQQRANDPESWLQLFTKEEIKAADEALGRCKGVKCGPAVPVCDLSQLGKAYRVKHLIAHGIPTPEDEFYHDWSRDKERDEKKTEGAWVHEVMCGCLKAGFTFEQILGIFTDKGTGLPSEYAEFDDGKVDTGWPINKTALSKEDPEAYVKFMLANAAQAQLNGAPPPRSDADYQAYGEWFIRQSVYTNPASEDAYQAFEAERRAT